MPNLKEWQQVLHQGAVERGWYDGDLGEKTPLRIASLLALVHSEVSEALEDLRMERMETTYVKPVKIINNLERSETEIFTHSTGKPEGFPSELADIIIRVLDMAEWLGVDMEKEVEIKNKYNEHRGKRHGGKVL